MITITLDNHEFEVVYQALMEARDNAIIDGNVWDMNAVQSVIEKIDRKVLEHE